MSEIWEQHNTVKLCADFLQDEVQVCTVVTFKKGKSSQTFQRHELAIRPFLFGTRVEPKVNQATGSTSLLEISKPDPPSFRWSDLCTLYVSIIPEYKNSFTLHCRLPTLSKFAKCRLDQKSLGQKSRLRNACWSIQQKLLYVSSCYVEVARFRTKSSESFVRQLCNSSWRWPTPTLLLDPLLSDPDVCLTKC